MSHRTRHRWEYEFDRLVRFHIKQPLLIPFVCFFIFFLLKHFYKIFFLVGHLRIRTAPPPSTAACYPYTIRPNLAHTTPRFVAQHSIWFCALWDDSIGFVLTTQPFFLLVFRCDNRVFIIIHNLINNFGLSHHGAVSGT